jgi:L-amino acid N-acyltransferase YncA
VLAVRDATLGDAAAVAAIYNEGIASRRATFDTEPCSVEDVAADLRADSSTHPTVVVVDGDRVLGFAWTSSYRARACYDGVAEFSVYVAADARRRGVGLLALAALAERCERLGFWKLVSRIFADNTASRALCVESGFREVGIYRRHGRLDGEWKDCVIVERLLGAAARAEGAT